MDSFQLWKDDYRREVEDVLAERRRAREKGERPDTAPGEGFAGRLADLVIPPAGIHAEAVALRSRLAEAEALNADLNRRTEEAETASARERDRRERIKDAAARLAVDLRGLQAEVLVAREQTRLSFERVADAERAARERAEIDDARVREARLEADHASARAEDAERASAVRLQASREFHARFDALQLDVESKAAEIVSLKIRLDVALRRAADAEARGAEVDRRLHDELVSARAELAAARSAVEDHSNEGAELERRAKENWEAAVSAADQAVRARAEARAEVVRREALEAALQQEALRAASAERAADESAAAAREARSASAEAGAIRAEAERAMAEARRLEAELPARLASAIGDERASAELARAAAASALAKASDMEKESLKRRDESERRLSDEIARLTHEFEARSHAAFAEGLSAERLRAEHAERELESARRAEAAAIEKTREVTRALGKHRDQMQDVASRLIARASREHLLAEKSAAELRRREAEAKSRFDAEAGRQAAILEEERARLKAELEDERGRLEAELDAERAGLHERWREQAELLEKLRQARGRNPEP